MSDTSQGAGWWLASDGKWYPPEQGGEPDQSGEAAPDQENPEEPQHEESGEAVEPTAVAYEESGEAVEPPEVAYEESGEAVEPPEVPEGQDEQSEYPEPAPDPYEEPEEPEAVEDSDEGTYVPIGDDVGDGGLGGAENLPEGDSGPTHVETQEGGSDTDDEGQEGGSDTDGAAVPIDLSGLATPRDQDWVEMVDRVEATDQPDDAGLTPIATAAGTGRGGAEVDDLQERLAGMGFGPGERNDDSTESSGLVTTAVGEVNLGEEEAPEDAEDRGAESARSERGEPSGGPDEEAARLFAERPAIADPTAQLGEFGSGARGVPEVESPRVVQGEPQFTAARDIGALAGEDEATAEVLDPLVVVEIPDPEPTEERGEDDGDTQDTFEVQWDAEVTRRAPDDGDDLFE